MGDGAPLLIRRRKSPVSRTGEVPATGDGEAGLDCVVIGYHDVDFHGMERRLKPSEHLSGDYFSLKETSVLFGGRRIPYMDLLNQVLPATRRGPSELAVAELPNLAVAYLASFLRKRGFVVDFVNFFTREQDRLARLLAQAPRAVAITTTFYVDPLPIVEIVEAVRRLNPETKIVVGGPHVWEICTTADPRTQDAIFRRMGADIYVFEPQGELTLARVLEALREPDADLSQVPNLIVRTEDGGFVRTPSAAENNDMDAGSIDWRLFDTGFFAPTTQVRTARSCAYKCAFCRFPIRAGALALTSIDAVEAELRLLRDAGVENVVFIDDTFNVPLPRFKEICRMMIRNQFGFRWFSYFRCGNADADTWDLMKQSGCAGVFLGIESADQGVLDNMNKLARVARYEHGIRELKARDIITFAAFIIGYPGETRESVERTIDFVERSGPTFYRPNLYFHSTKFPIHERASEFGLRGTANRWHHDTMSWNEAVEWVGTMYRSVRSSVVLPLHMFDFWAIPYLLGKGITVEELRDFLRIAQELMVAGLDDVPRPTAEHERRLRAVFARAEPDPPHRAPP